MNLSEQLAKHLKDVHFGGNWTTSNLRDVISGVTWQQATTKVGDCNTIATLVFHINYYISAVTKVLEGQPLNAKDSLSFDHPPVASAHDWENMLTKVFADAEVFATLISQLPDDIYGQPFTDEKYGTYYRNIQGIIEHTHYHLGQIAIITKMLPPVAVD